jgi:hypothetical protein
LINALREIRRSIHSILICTSFKLIKIDGAHDKYRSAMLVQPANSRCLTPQLGCCFARYKQDFITTGHPAFVDKLDKNKTDETKLILPVKN